MPEDLHQHKHTPEEALACAIGEATMMDDPFVDVVVIYKRKSGKFGSFDSDMEPPHVGYLCDLFKQWMLNESLGVIMGDQAEAIKNAVLDDQP